MLGPGSGRGARAYARRGGHGAADTTPATDGHDGQAAGRRATGLLRAGLGRAVEAAAGVDAAAHLADDARASCGERPCTGTTGEPPWDGVSSSYWPWAPARAHPPPRRRSRPRRTPP